MPQVTRESRQVTRERRIVETATEARAGVTGHNVRHVLMISLTASIVVLIAIAAIAFY